MPPGAHDSLSPAAADAIADRFRILAEPTRLRLLDLLRGGERTVGDLTAALGCSGANTSKHLALMADAGVLCRRRDGLRCYYAVADASVFALCDAAREAVQRHRLARAGELGGA